MPSATPWFAPRLRVMIWLGPVSASGDLGAQRPRGCLAIGLHALDQKELALQIFDGLQELVDAGLGRTQVGGETPGALVCRGREAGVLFLAQPRAQPVQGSADRGHREVQHRLQQTPRETGDARGQLAVDKQNNRDDKQDPLRGEQGRRHDDL